MGISFVVFCAWFGAVKTGMESIRLANRTICDWVEHLVGELSLLHRTLSVISVVGAVPEEWLKDQRHAA